MVRNARGKPVRHHQTYELVLGNGSVLRTRISRPVDRTTYGLAMWRHILVEQLAVDEDEFWDCVLRSVRPRRDRASAEASSAALPASLVHHLLHEVRLTEQEVASMSREEAIARMQQYWSNPGSGS